MPRSDAVDAPDALPPSPVVNGALFASVWNADGLRLPLESVVFRARLLSEFLSRMIPDLLLVVRVFGRCLARTHHPRFRAFLPLCRTTC